MSDNTEQEDIILKFASRFHPKLSRQDIIKLDPIFCVDSLSNTRILSMHKREIRVIKKFREKFGFPDNYKLKDIIDKFNNCNIRIVRRPVRNGIKIDEELIIENGIFMSIDSYGFSYDTCNIKVKINDEYHLVSPDRVYFLNNNN